jgi:hypothetical protein
VATKSEVKRVILGDDYYPYRYPVPSEYTSDFMASEDERWAVLESIGIERRDDETLLGAWRDAVADESGIPREKLNPRTGRGLDLGFSPAYVRKFAFYLA